MEKIDLNHRIEGKAPILANSESAYYSRKAYYQQQRNKRPKTVIQIPFDQQQLEAGDEVYLKRDEYIQLQAFFNRRLIAKIFLSGKQAKRYQERKNTLFLMRGYWIGQNIAESVELQPFLLNGWKICIEKS